MASGRTRSTRKLRNWMVEQVSSGKYPGLIWDDEAKTMFRIPWKHAGKQDFRSDEDAAIFKAWAEFKGKLSDSGPADPASWKTRLRCALNKSPEFKESQDRSQLDISEPYKVYRLVPVDEQGKGKDEVRSTLKLGRRKRRSSESDSEEDKAEAKRIKEEIITPRLIRMSAQAMEDAEAVAFLPNGLVPPVITMKRDETVDEIQLDLTFETAPPSGEDSFQVSVQYLGQEVLRRGVLGSDVRISYLPFSAVPPTSHSLIVGGFPRILLPEPPGSLTSRPDVGPRLQALTSLLPYMERGVVLTSTGTGIYGKRFCQGRVFWTGPHTASPGPLKMERTMDPILLFSKDVFKEELDRFRFSGGSPPDCGITLCFGEELSDTDDPSSKLIIAQITSSWAEHQAQEAVNFRESIALLQNLASQSPLGEVTLNLVPCP